MHWQLLSVTLDPPPPFTLPILRDLLEDTPHTSPYRNLSMSCSAH